MAVSINVCNLALGELRAPAIVDISEESREAEECARYYDQCLKILLERLDWSFATRIAPLAAFAVNDRAGEWGFAYALPTDAATPKRLVPEDGFYSDWMVGQYDTFIVEAGVLYSNIPNAVLEYSTQDVSETVMSSLFIDALGYSLAARLAVPIRDSRELKGELLKQAEIATQRAMADDMNRQPRRQHVDADEVTIARGLGNADWSRRSPYLATT